MPSIQEKGRIRDWMRPNLLNKFRGFLFMKSPLNGRESGSIQEVLKLRGIKTRTGFLDMVQSATPDGSVSESRRLDKSTDTTPLAYAVESLTRCSRILNLVQPSA